MLEDETRNAWNNQEQQNRRGHPQTDSKPRIPGGQEKNAGIKTDGNAKSCAQIANYQKVGEGTKKTFLGKNRGSKGAVTRDEGKVNEIRNRTSFFKG